MRKEFRARAFDPDTLDQQGWRAFGFSNAQARSILKYKHSLGGFKNKAQLRRSYVISAEKFRQIEPFIRFSRLDKSREASKPLSMRRASSGHTPYRLFDLNAVSLRVLRAWRPLRRVAVPLVHYRELLGGYGCFSQLREVYHMDAAALDFLCRYARIEPASVHKIDLNRVDFQTLLRHPYFDYARVQQVFQLRRRAGRFRSVEALRNLPAFRGCDFDKIKLYLRAD